MMMLRVIVVDDEKLIRDGLVLRLEQFACVRVDGVFDGAEGAMEYLSGNEADLIITDIRMVGCDGLALSEWIKKRQPRMRIIIVSGYSDFAYTGKAIGLGIDNYLLKPIKKEEFARVIGEAARSLDKLDRESIKAILNGAANNRKLICRDAAHSRFFDSNTRCFRLAFFQVFTEAAAEQSDDRQLLLDVPNCIMAVNATGSNGYLLFAGGRDSAGCMETIERVAERLLAKGQRAVLSVSREGAPDTSLSALYLDAEDLLASRLLAGAGPLLLRHSPQRLSARSILRERKPIARRLPHYLELTSDERCRKGVERILEQCFAKPPDNVESYGFVRALYLQMLQAVADFFETGRPADTEGQPLGLEGETFDQLLNFSELRGHLMNAILYSRGNRYRKDDSSKSNLAAIGSYIAENYANDLTLAMLADQFNFNPSHLSIIFKKEFGLSFTDYLCTTRIEKALVLLRDKAQPLWEVAMRVGFRDQPYFNRVFKRVTGFTPKEYRLLLEGEKNIPGTGGLS